MFICVLNLPAVLLLANQVLGQVQLSPRSATVLSGAQARFNCSTATPWVALAWSVNGSVVISVSEEHGILSNSDRFTVENRTTARSFEWELVWNVTRSDNGEVTCDFQNIGKETATLSVQEAGTVSIEGKNVTSRRGTRLLFRCQASGWFPEPRLAWALDAGDVSNQTSGNATASGGLFHSTSALAFRAEESTRVQCQASIPALRTPRTDSVFLTIDPGGENRTVLIAVLVSVLGTALLLLLIIAIVCCCVSRRKSARAEEARGNGQQSDDVTHQTWSGQDNLGYSWPENTGFSQSELRSDRGQTNSVSAHQQAPVIREHGDFLKDPSANGTKKVRLATTV